MNRFLLIFLLLPLVGHAQFRGIPAATNLTDQTKWVVDDAIFGTRTVTWQYMSNLMATFGASDTKQDAITGAASSVTSTNLLTERLLISDDAGKITQSNVTSVEAGYLAGLTNAVQAQIDGRLAQVSTLADLIALDPTRTPLAATAGYHTPGDGGAGTYRWTNSLPSGVSTNRGDWFAGSTGFWGLIHNGEVNVKQWGTPSNGVDDDKAIIQELSDLIQTRTSGIGKVIIPPGDYRIWDNSSRFNFYGPAIWEGQKGAKFTLMTNMPGGAAVLLRGTNIVMRGVEVDCNYIPGQNGITTSLDSETILIENCIVRNAVFSESVLGGRAFTCQLGPRDVMFRGNSVSNAYQAFDVHGRLGISTGEQPSTGIRFVDNYAEDVDELISVMSQNNDTFPQNPDMIAVIFSGTMGKNVGLNRHHAAERVVEMESYTASTITVSGIHFFTLGDRVKFSESFGNVVEDVTYYVRSTPSTTTFTLSGTDAISGSEYNIGGSASLSCDVSCEWWSGGIISINRGGNFLIEDTVVWYDSDEVRSQGPVIRGKASRGFVKNMIYHGSADVAVDGRAAFESVPWSTGGQGLQDCHYDITVYGTLNLAVNAEQGGQSKFTRNNIKVSSSGLKWGVVPQVADTFTLSNVEYRHMPSGAIVKGDPKNIYASGNMFADRYSIQHDAARIGQMNVTKGDGGRLELAHVDALGEIRILRNGLQMLRIDGDGVTMPISSFDGGRIFTYGVHRNFNNSGTMLYNNLRTPTNSTDGRVVGWKTLARTETNSFTYRVFDGAPLIKMQPSENMTVTLSQENVLTGDLATFWKPYADDYTVTFTGHTGGDLVIPAGDRATVDMVFHSGDGWRVVRYSTDRAPLKGTLTHNFPSIAAGGTSVQTTTITGATVGQFVSVAPVMPSPGIIVQADVTASNTITVRAHNITGSAIDPDEKVFNLRIIR
jgi:hypothetical protein